MASSWIEETNLKLRAELPIICKDLAINAEVAVIFYPDIDCKGNDLWRADSIIAVYAGDDEQRHYLNLSFTESDIRYMTFLKTFREELKSLLNTLEGVSAGLEAKKAQV